MIDMFKNKLNILLIGLLFLSGMAVSVIASETIDPTYIGVGARSLGMGRAFTAISNDGSSMFTNPAGLDLVKGIKVISMNGNLMNEVPYVTLGVSNSILNGTLGIGYTGVSFTGIKETNLVGITPEATGNLGGLTDSVLTLSYATDFKKMPIINLLKGSFFENSKIGVSAKYINQGFSGSSSFEAGNASGFDADLGFISSIDNSTSLGVMIKNILPGNTLKADELPMLITVGGSKTFFDYNLLTDLDLEFSKGVLLHLGGEWTPVKFLRIRAGLDQLLFAGTSVTNYTAGVGIRYNDLSFDYAYHTYADLADLGTHYFSISYEKPHEKGKEGPFIEILAPKDKTILYDKNIIVRVNILSHDVEKIAVNGKEVNVLNLKATDISIPLNIGKNTVNVVSFDKKGNILSKNKIRVLCLATFKDLNKDYWTKLPIEQLATLGLLADERQGENFNADKIVKRSEFIAMFLKVKGAEVLDFKDLDDSYLDTPSNYWAKNYIETSTQKGFVVGYPDKTFKPENKINFAEGLTFLARYENLNSKETTVSPYKGISPKYWASGQIAATKKAGFLTYVKDDFFDPRKKLTKGETVWLISRTKDASEKINDLMDFEKGY